MLEHGKNAIRSAELTNLGMAFEAVTDCYTKLKTAQETLLTLLHRDDDSEYDEQAVDVACCEAQLCTHMLDSMLDYLCEASDALCEST